MNNAVNNGLCKTLCRFAKPFAKPFLQFAKLRQGEPLQNPLQNPRRDTGGILQREILPKGSPIPCRKEGSPRFCKTITHSCCITT